MIKNKYIVNGTILDGVEFCIECVATNIKEVVDLVMKSNFGAQFPRIKMIKEVEQVSAYSLPGIISIKNNKGSATNGN